MLRSLNKYRSFTIFCLIKSFGGTLKIFMDGFIYVSLTITLIYSSNQMFEYSNMCDITCVILYVTLRDICHNFYFFLFQQIQSFWGTLKKYYSGPVFYKSASGLIQQIYCTNHKNFSKNQKKNLKLSTLMYSCTPRLEFVLNSCPKG